MEDVEAQISRGRPALASDRGQKVGEPDVIHPRGLLPSLPFSLTQSLHPSIEQPIKQSHFSGATDSPCKIH